MKIIFFGTSGFAVPSLIKLNESKHEISLIVTQPDRKKGRDLSLGQSPVKAQAKKLKLAVHQPENASGAETINLIKKKTADLFVVAAFGQLLKKELLSLPRLYSINLHASLLPKYRGAAPINWAVINGEKKTGVSIIKMNEKMDEGDVILSKEIDIHPKDTSQALDKKLSELGADTLLEAIALMEKRTAKPVKQDETLASYAAKLKKKDGLIEWKKPAGDLHNRVRGLLPWPTAFTYWNKKILKIYKSEVALGGSDSEPGRIVSFNKEGIVVKTGSGNLVIVELQLEGSKRMDAASFLRGRSLKVGDKLG